MASDAPLRLRDRLALKVEEAARTLGMSVGSFREHLLPNCPKIRAGRGVRIPLEPFKKYLELRAEQDREDFGDSIEELFEGLDDEP